MAIKASDLIGLFQQALSEKWGYIWGTDGIKWTKAKQDQINQTTDESRALSRKYGAKWIGHTVADCSGLFSWAFEQLGGTMYHGSNTMYLKWCAEKGELKSGKRTDGDILKPGTAVFCWNGKTYSHVGLYIGGDTVIEAAGTQEGVTTSKVSATKWKYWGELTGVEFDVSGDDPAPAPTPTPDPAPSPAGKPTIRKGSKGEYVTLAQTMLINRGYNLDPYGADGSFGMITEKAVKAFQRDWDLTADGIIGPKTWAMLESSPAKQQTYRVIFTGLTESEARALLAKWTGGTMERE